MKNNWVCYAAFGRFALVYRPDGGGAMDYWQFVGTSNEKALAMVNKGI